MTETALKNPIAALQSRATKDWWIDLQSPESAHRGSAGMRERTASSPSSGVSLPQQPPIMQARSSSLVDASPTTEAQLPAGIDPSAPRVAATASASAAAATAREDDIRAKTEAEAVEAADEEK
eukprot:CAMPEP_0180065070 /NCGR_PEP_ID=MMETSP0985-20121206/8523_1 /TAXON_ID=483367 /ORGANISM="non described non described, Strain CCMP 2436" /LENGTH=122 /DNA_ID=CAMNT_0021995423 /DNA_START=389 /DNA_END=757 /DNA_ORIENTATION=-